MTHNEAPGTGGDDDSRWREAVELANIPTLLMVLVQLTGELHWLQDPYRPTRTRGLGDNDDGGLPERIQHEIRSHAFDAIRAWRNGRPLALPDPSHELLVEMMSVTLGETVPSEYATMIADELQLDGLEPPGGPTRSGRTPVVTVDDDGRPVSRRLIATPGHGDRPRAHAEPGALDVIVIGAGVSGICAGVRLQEAGIPYMILEKNETVGGTWLENHYPGCGVDTPSHLYSFSFAKHDWSQYFALRDELYEYLEQVAADFGVREHIRFGTVAERARYDESAQRWAVEVDSEERGRETLTASVLVTAVGAFNKPKMPNVKGANTFAGPTAHTARWPHEGVDLDGKRVAVIGTGASAMQLVPAIVDEVESLVVFQRSPQWAAPFEKFHKKVPEPVRFLLLEMPLYYAWYRLRLAWAFNDKIYPALQKDASWPHPERAVNAINDGHRRYFTRYIVEELGERQDLLDKTLPSYPPFGKRMLMDNGWFRTMTRDNVELVTEHVAEVCTDRVVTTSGAEFEADVLVWATGFDVVHFLAGIEITGRGGLTLESAWDGDDARAYFGATVPGFPNFFCLYGPNTQFGHGGSLITVMERQVHYLLSVLTQMSDLGIGEVEVREDVHDRYNERIDEAHANMVWTHQGMDTYYRNSRGRVVVNNPFRMVDYWRWTESAGLRDYHTTPKVMAPTR